MTEQKKERQEKETGRERERKGGEKDICDFKNDLNSPHLQIEITFSNCI